MQSGTRPVLAADVSFEELSALTDGYTGADLAGLVRQASMLALKESLNNADLKLEDLCVNQAHFTKAIQMLRPSVSSQVCFGVNKFSNHLSQTISSCTNKASSCCQFLFFFN